MAGRGIGNHVTSPTSAGLGCDLEATAGASSRDGKANKNPGHRTGVRFFFAKRGLVALALQALAHQLARTADGFGALAGAALTGLLVVTAELHLAEDPFALHLLLQDAQRLIDIVFADENLHFDRFLPKENGRPAVAQRRDGGPEFEAGLVSQAPGLGKGPAEAYIRAK